MKEKIRFLKKNKQSFIALLMLLVMVFTTCRDPLDSNFTGDDLIGGNTYDITPINPMWFFIDSDCNFSETDTGRIGLVADEDAYVVFYSDDIDSETNRVGLTFKDKIVVFNFEKNHHFPINMVLSDAEESLNGFFSPYDHVTQTYGLTFEQDGDKETWSNIPLSMDVFTNYIDDPELTPSQNIRMRNLYIAVCIYESIYNYIDSEETLNAGRSLKNFLKGVINLFNDPNANIAVGNVAVSIGVIAGIISFVYPPASVIWVPIAYNAIYFGVVAIMRGIELESNVPISWSDYYPVTGVSLRKTSVNLHVGDTETLYASIKPDNASNKSVIWSSSNTDVATVTPIGTVTGRSVGTAIISVTTLDGGKTANCTVIVNPTAVTSVTINKTSTSILEGNLETLYATVNPYYATNKNVSWSSNDTDVATVSNDGKVTGVSAGTAIITVTTDDGNYKDSCIVTVNASTVNVTGITISQTTAMIDVDSTLNLNTVITPANATNQNLIWSSSNVDVASVTSGGVVTAHKFGTAIITVTSVENPSLYATCTVDSSYPIYVTDLVTINNSTREITDSGTFNQPYDHVDFGRFLIDNTPIDLTTMKAHGYKTISFLFLINVAEEDDGYQHIYLFNSPNHSWDNYLGGITFEHTRGKKDTSLWFHVLLVENISIDAFIDNSFTVRYSASGDYWDDWWTDTTQVQLRFQK